MWVYIIRKSTYGSLVTPNLFYSKSEREQDNTPETLAVPTGRRRIHSFEEKRIFAVDEKLENVPFNSRHKTM
jgi:hypothetical protein